MFRHANQEIDITLAVVFVFVVRRQTGLAYNRRLSKCFGTAITSPMPPKKWSLIVEKNAAEYLVKETNETTFSRSFLAMREVT